MRILMLFSMAFVIFACNSDSPETTSTITKTNIKKEEIHIYDGLYLLNGSQEDGVKIKRKNSRESYLIQPKPFVKSEAYKNVEIIKEPNEMYSLRINLEDASMQTWKDSIAHEDIHYVGVVSKNELVTIIKVKGDNKREDVYLNCVSGDKSGAEEISKRIKL